MSAITIKISSNLLETITTKYNNLLFIVERVTGVFEIPSGITFAKNKFDGYIIQDVLFVEKHLYDMFVMRVQDIDEFVS